MENIDQIKEELNRLVDQSEYIYSEINNIRTSITNIEEGRDRIIQLRELITLTQPITVRLIELNRINSDYAKLIDTYIDENGIDYEIVLFDEINYFIELVEQIFNKKMNNLEMKIKMLETINEPRNIPEDENELIQFNKQIINQSTCSICLDRVVNIRIDCGHLFCSNCVINLNKCPFCRTSIKQLDKIFLQKYLKYRTKYMALKNNLHNKV